METKSVSPIATKNYDKALDTAGVVLTGGIIGGTAGALYGMSKKPDVFEYTQTGAEILNNSVKEFMKTTKEGRHLANAESIAARAQEGIQTASKRIKTLNKMKKYPKAQKWLAAFVQKHQNELFVTEIKGGKAQKTLKTFANIDDAVKFFTDRKTAFAKNFDKAANLLSNAAKNTINGSIELQRQFLAGKGKAYDAVLYSFKNNKAKQIGLLGALFTGIGAGAAVLMQKERVVKVPIAVPVPVAVPVGVPIEMPVQEAENKDITEIKEV